MAEISDRYGGPAIVRIRCKIAGRFGAKVRDLLVVGPYIYAQGHPDDPWIRVDGMLTQSVTRRVYRTVYGEAKDFPTIIRKAVKHG